MRLLQASARPWATVVLAGVAAIAFLAGCGKSPSGNANVSPASPPAEAPTQNVTTASVAEPEGPKAGEKICFACKGKGTVKCMSPGCVNGLVDCPGPCLKLDRGVWVHIDVPGHPPTDVWQKFVKSDGSYAAYNQNHVGHVIVFQNGAYVDSGPCKVCGGTGKVPCSVCKGTGEQPCPICDGKKYIPESWTPTDNPWLNRQPDLIRLNDGRILFGKVVSTFDKDITIKTRDGKWLHVNQTNMAPASPAGSAK